MTDEWPAYRGIGTEFAGGHQAVNHGQGEYVSGDVHVKAKSYFALLKRGVIGSFHHITSGILTVTAMNSASVGIIARPRMPSGRQRRSKAQKAGA